MYTPVCSWNLERQEFQVVIIKCLHFHATYSGMLGMELLLRCFPCALERFLFLHRNGRCGICVTGSAPVFTSVFFISDHWCNHLHICQFGHLCLVPKGAGPGIRMPHPDSKTWWNLTFYFLHQGLGSWGAQLKLRRTLKNMFMRRDECLIQRL